MYKVMEEIEEVVGDKTTVEADDLDNMNQVKNNATMYICTRLHAKDIIMFLFSLCK